MDKVFSFPRQPRVFHPVFILQLRRVNTVCRWLRDRGIRVLAVDFSEDDKPLIVVDRNAHAAPPNCYGLSIVVRR